MVCLTKIQIKIMQLKKYLFVYKLYFNLNIEIDVQKTFIQNL